MGEALTMQIQNKMQCSVQFGRLKLGVKSLTEATNKEQTRMYRQARKSYSDAIAKLDRAGVDIEIRAKKGEESSTVQAFVMDKQRNVYGMTFHNADASPWDVLSNAIVRGLQVVDFENPKLTDKQPATPIAVIKNDKLVPTGEGVTHKLSHRGRVIETGRVQLDA
jgi:hypothetical protein